MELSEYQLETLREDGEFILYRGQHHSRIGEVLPPVLVVAPVSERPALRSLRRIEHKYAIRAELDPGWAVRPFALAPHQGRTVLVLTDPGGEPLDRLLGRPMELAPFLRCAIGLSSALGHLHGRGLIHKDIKPANVLVHPATGQAWLMGFGVASRLPRQRQSPEPPEFMAGTLAYMASEQTGRMNRSMDSRSDLYALGVTLYEMLTGSLPFTASDPMEWVHCHIARQPVAPGEWVNGVPAPVSAIIVKLLAKTAEERYQTAAGVEADPRQCLAAWELRRRIDPFTLGAHDTPDRLLIPETLYGRARAIDTLLASFDRIVASGTPELVLVSGYAGIGKSSVVNELHKVLVPPRGLFASGKFDQYKRDIPYATLAQAFQRLIRPLLGKSEAELNSWRETLREALGPNGRLMVDLVPELKLIIGEQPLVPDLPPQDAQRRFQLVFRRFISVFARPEHPLALFLDDVQWLDAATLDLLEDLLTRPDVQHLMVIGAYRDHEVDSAHPLVRKLDAIRQAGAIVQEIILAPLACEDLGRLLADALHCDAERVAPLAQLVHEKTAGNPFFAIQFLSALAEEALLTFDHGHARWSWDLKRIHAKGHTDNVVDLMVGKLNRLPVETQKALQQLACMGNSAEFALLAMIHEDSRGDMHGDLWEAVRTGLVFRSEGAYRFLHDRVQEAAYALIPADLRVAAHLRIGRLLAAHTPSEKREEAIFEIVNQLNRGASLITSRDEREQLAELNLIAGKRAKASTAYASALTYLTAGAALLAEDCWDRRYELAFALELNRAECEFLTGALAEAEQRLTALSARAATTVERASVTCRRADLYTTLDQGSRAIAVGLEYLRHVGVDWSPHPTEDEARREYERIWSQLGSRTIEDLIELPLMSDPVSLATLDVLSKMATPASYTDANLYLLVICRQVNLSLEHGNCDASCFAYEWLAMVTGARFGDYRAAYSFGRLGYELVEQRGMKRFQARTYMIFGNLIIPWTRHVKSGRDLLWRSFEAANKIGDLTYAAYSCEQLNTNMLAAGDSLVEAQREFENGLEFARKVRFGLVIDLISAELGLVRTLRGLTRKFGSFDDDQFGEREIERRFASNPDLTLAECWYSIRKLQARFFAGDYAAALEAASTAQRLLWTSVSRFETAEYHFYGALSHAASCDSAAGEQRRQHIEAVTAHYSQLEAWAANCPDNFENRAALVGAEIARIEGRDVEAMRLYEQAIRSARANGFVHNEALANELAARFYAARGFEKIAHAYLQDARYCYRRWGAAGKVRHLNQLYPHLREGEPVPGPTSTIGAPVEHLDLATVIKVSQAVSGEIVLEKLIATLMLTAIEHAGAERGLLLLPRGNELRIEAEATTSGDTVVVRPRDASVAAAALPESIVHYVVRTQESVILDDASAQNPFAADTYIREHHARSILCVPLLKQAKLIRVLYLENNLTSYVFTPTRITVLKLLASQAAISLENTRLYSELTERDARIRRLVEANIIGIVIWNLDGRIIEANEAFLRMVGYGREDLVSGRVRWREVTPDKWREADEQALAELAATGICEPFEKEYFRQDGSRVPVLVGAALVEERRDEGVAFVLDLTERKRADEALRRSEAYSAEAQRLSHTGSWAFDVATRQIVHWSQEHFRIFGFDPAQGMPSFETFRQRIHPDDQARAADILERAVRERTDYELDCRIVLPDGAMKYIRAVGHPVFNASADPVEFVGTVMDMTERQRAEEERQAHLWFLESMDQVNRAIQGTNDLEQMISEVLDAVLSIFNCDRAWLVYPCDPEASSYAVQMQRTRPEFPGTFAPGVDVPMDQDDVRVLKTVRAASGPVRFGLGSEQPLPAGLARRFNVQSRIAMAVYPKLDRPYMFGLSQCSDPRVWTPQEERLFQEIGRRLEDALTSFLMFRHLRTSERNLEEAQRLAHVGYWERDPETDRITWSDETYRIFGLPPQARILTLAQLPDLIHPDDQQSMIHAVAEALRGGRRYDVEYRVVRPTGEVRLVHSQGDVLRDESGRTRRMFGSVQDITERRRAEEALHQAQAALAHVTRVATLGELSASIAPEVNQPLAGVVTNGQACLRWLAREVPDLQEARAAVEWIIGDGHRASEVIRRIRAFATKTDPHEVPLDLNDVIREVARLVHREVLGHRVSLRTDLAAVLPQVLGDRVQLQQVLINLVINGIEAMTSVTDRPRELWIRSHQPAADQVCVTVQDSGIGIDPADLDRLFHAFFTTKTGGMGMGLSISRSIIEAHGGRLWAAAHVPHGAVFQFTLPMGRQGVA